MKATEEAVFCKRIGSMENKLSLKYLIEILRMEHEIELRDKDDDRLFECSTTSPALEPYFNREVIDWFIPYRQEKVVICIGDEVKNDGLN